MLQHDCLTTKDGCNISWGGIGIGISWGHNPCETPNVIQPNCVPEPVRLYLAYNIYNPNLWLSSLWPRILALYLMSQTTKIGPSGGIINRLNPNWNRLYSTQHKTNQAASVFVNVIMRRGSVIKESFGLCYTKDSCVYGAVGEEMWNRCMDEISVCNIINFFLLLLLCIGITLVLFLFSSFHICQVLRT